MKKLTEIVKRIISFAVRGRSLANQFSLSVGLLHYIHLMQLLPKEKIPCVFCGENPQRGLCTWVVPSRQWGHQGYGIHAKSQAVNLYSKRN